VSAAAGQASSAGAAAAVVSSVIPAISSVGAAPSLATPLEDDARALARAQRQLERAGRINHFFEPPPVARRLERARRQLGAGPPLTGKLQTAAEWLLDNYYLIRRVARQVEEELPRGFVRHLPQLASGPERGRPRIDAISHALVVSSGLAIDLPGLRRFIDAYQEVAPLTIAELWALPTTLRAAVLQHLLALLGQLGVAVAPDADDADGHVAALPPLAIEPGAGVERAIRALRVLDSIDWKDFFEKTNRVEAILRTAPARIYQRMDFATCDAYRKVVEQLAWGSGRAEEDVAAAAVAMAHSGAAGTRRGLVGTYLVAEGRRELEARLGYRPAGVERLRRLVLRWPTASYLGALGGVTALLLGALGAGLWFGAGAGAVSIAVALAVALVPASAVAIALVQFAVARLLPPRTLPKLDFKKGLPADARTLVVMPTLLGRAEDIAAMVRQLELHYLSNTDPQLQFALLTDDLDSPHPPPDPASAPPATEGSPGEPLVERLAREIAALNAHHGKDGRGPFHLLHRHPRWNPAEGCYMGWERKRGKLEELNRLLRGDRDTSYTRHAGDPAGLKDIRFVITLDSDTELPMGSAHRLVGLLAHPLNRAVFDDKTGRVVAGYTVVQPRVDTSPSSTRQTRFSRLFAGDIGFDIYTHASSELYQDLFGAGIYVGKGIYDVDAFMRSVDGCVPENSLVSHDLFEGVHGRAALATDIVLFEHYPESYATFAMRMHRWVRGDWQLLPWLLPRVPCADGGRRWNRLAAIDRWKIADNLRRSLTAPLSLALLVLGWSWLPGGPLLWTSVALAFLVAPSWPSLLGGRRRRAEALGRAGLALAFLVYESTVVVDAIARVLVRKAITGKHLLQWTSAAQAELKVAARSPRELFWKSMLASPLGALAIGALVAWAQPVALAVAAPILAVWLAAPELARWMSARQKVRTEQLDLDSLRQLRMLARRTWRFFDVFVGPTDQWLPIDNYQAEPREQTAHRTSPTNIGLSMLATLTAYDFGYIGASELALRVRLAFDSIARMQHYQGHLFNWYDTKNLQPLLPRYVSTVDSGNFAGCLLALARGCRDVASAPVVRPEAWEGLRDSLDLLDEVVATSPGTADSLRAVLRRMRQATLLGRDELARAHSTLRLLTDTHLPELDRELLAFVEVGSHRHEVELLHALRISSDRLHQQLRQQRRELDTLMPWLSLAAELTACGLELPARPRLDEIPELCRRGRAELSERRTPATEEAAARLEEALHQAEANADTLLAELAELELAADAEVRGMDFRLLYDPERKLFHIGYNATNDQLDANYYDLLASEARLASYLAIVKRDVPQSHWYALGRPMTQLPGGPALLSWGGTMFEYLMPSLLMRSRPGTLLARTCAAVVDAHIAYAAPGEPWGISESGYAHVDAGETYQYRSFGVPGLGFKRGLEEDRVVTPYASLLAVAIRPQAVVANVSALTALGMLGPYGLHEAIDFTPDRARARGEGEAPFSIVRSYMAHHQGMLLIALGNLLNRRSMVERFHADPLVETAEMLLNEQAPDAVPAEWPTAEAGKPSALGEPLPPAPPSWDAAVDTVPQAFALSNGRLTSWVTQSGGGGLRWQGLALTRYQIDATSDDDGLWIYLRDEDSRRVWLATEALGRTTFSMHKTAHHLRAEGISVHVDIAVAAADDVEVRLVTLHNETDRPRRLTATTAGRPVLFDANRAPSHPAFSSLFVESEPLAELDALIFSRRRQTPEEERAVMVHRLVGGGRAVSFAGFESDRNAFYGRGGSLRAPRALAAGTSLGGGHGAVVDPIMSLGAHVELPAKGSVSLAFVTTVARSRSAAIELARKYGSMHAVRWAFRDAEQESPRRLQREKLEPQLLPWVQRLASALFFVDPALRASPEVRAAEPPCQRRLWGRGISGDHPILLVRVADPEAPLVPEVLAAQRYLRWCGLRLDLVFLDEQATGYLTEGTGTLRGVLLLHGAEEWLGRHGGVFSIAVDQVARAELRHLEAAARVVLDTRDGSLAARLGRAVERAPKLPRFEPTLVEPIEPVAAGANAALPPLPLAFANGTGGFSGDGREYVIDVVPGAPPPAPWSNVIANPQLGCLVSESSLGSTWSLNAGENRLTPWRNDPVFDPPSEALYLRDEETAHLWTPTPLPAGQHAVTRVRHGAGITTYQRASHGLEQELAVFVPPDAPLKIIRLRLKNTLPRHRRLTATYYAEWVLGSRREAQRPYVTSEMDREHGCLLARCRWNSEFGDRVAFLAAGKRVHGFTVDRTEFLGRRGELARPEGLERWGLSGRDDVGVDPCAALQVHLELAPGEELETHFVLGQAASREEALAAVARYREASAVAAAAEAVRVYWDDILGAIRVATPEPAMDVMLNRWMLYQSLSARFFGRTGFYQSSGAFGYRDQLQDVLALLHGAPQLARAHLLEAARYQFEEGDVLHWWHPPSGRGVRTRCSDDLAWLPYVAAEYVAATGDAAVFDEPVPFLAGAPLRPDERDRYAEYQPSEVTAPLIDHCRRALERAHTEGIHGLPLMGDGDWNDGMSRIGAEGRGESVWLAWFLAATMDRFAAALERFAAHRPPASGEASGEPASWRHRAAGLRATTDEVAWDGAWYLRAFHDDGSLVGSAQSRECRIDSIAQSWAVLAQPPAALRGAGPAAPGPDRLAARARAAVRQADDQLVREAERLVLLFWPPFDNTRHDPGYIRGYPPGIRENGGQYTHAATWLGFAHAALGDGAAAERIFRLLNPIARATTPADVARYRLEPYVLAGDIYSCAPWVGRGGWSWYTGSASWAWRLGVEAILGLRREAGHLRVEPCIPPTWKGFEAWVRDGRGTLHIVVENPDRVASGVAELTVDGQAIDDARIRLAPDSAATREVRVRLGAPSAARPALAAGAQGP
jgi:cyclic beta-1,2-glucan synthetase